MAPKRPRTTENEHELAIQIYSPPIKRPEIAPAISSSKPPVVVFAHGAGAPSTSEWMIRWRNLLAKALNPVEVVTFDYPYINGRRKAAPKPEKLVGFHTDVVKEVAAKYPEHPLILVGKSMGSRISCMVAAENDIRVSAVVCLGYPLKATNGVIRDETLLQLTVPIMFVQGGNDGFCPLASLEFVRKKLKAANALHVIENGDHSFQIAKKNLELTGMTHEEAEERAVEAVAMFVSQIRGEKVNKGSVIAHARFFLFPRVYTSRTIQLILARVCPVHIVVLIIVVHLVSHFIVQVLLHMFWAFAGTWLVEWCGQLAFGAGLKLL